MLSRVEVVHLPTDLNVYIALYRDVKNASFLREQLIKGNSEYEFAFVDARSVLSSIHLLAGVFRAVNEMNMSRMKSRNVHSEIVFCLNPNNNIAESFRRFGISDDTKNLLVVKVSNQGLESFSKLLDESVHGESVEFNDDNIKAISDEPFIRKTYKLPLAPKATLGNPDERKELELSILGLIALRGAT